MLLPGGFFFNISVKYVGFFHALMITLLQNFSNFWREGVLYSEHIHMIETTATKRPTTWNVAMIAMEEGHGTFHVEKLHCQHACFQIQDESCRV